MTILDKQFVVVPRKNLGFQRQSKERFSIFLEQRFHLISYNNMNKSKIKVKSKTRIMLLYVEGLEYVYLDLTSRQFYRMSLHAKKSSLSVCSLWASLLVKISGQ